MKILLDECVPRRLKASFAKHECWTVSAAGLAGLRNGLLLAAAENAGFEVLVTLDRGMKFEQNLRGCRIAVLIVRSRSNRLADLLPQVEACLNRLNTIRPGEIAVLDDTVDV